MLRAEVLRVVLGLGGTSCRLFRLLGCRSGATSAYFLGRFGELLSLKHVPVLTFEVPHLLYKNLLATFFRLLSQFLFNGTPLYTILALSLLDPLLCDLTLSRRGRSRSCRLARCLASGTSTL